MHSSGASRREAKAVCETITTSLRAQRSNPSSHGELDCFAALAMTALRSCPGCLKTESENRKRSATWPRANEPSCPDLIRASINLRNKPFEEDRSPVKPGDDDSGLLLSQLFLVRFDEIMHALKLEVDVRQFSGMHGGAESFLRVSPVDPA